MLRRALALAGLIALGFGCAGRRAPAPEPSPPRAQAQVDAPAARPASQPVKRADTQPIPPPPENWPEWLPWERVRPESAEISVTPEGDIRLSLTVEGGQLEYVAIPWIDALEGQGYVESRPSLFDYNFMTFSYHNPATALRAGLAVSRPLGRWDSDDVDVTLTIVADDDAPPSKHCVTPPQRTRSFELKRSGIDQRGQRFSDVEVVTVATQTTPDIDGDGVDDLLVPHAKGGRCPADVEFNVYLMRGACGLKIGTIVGPVTTTQPYDPKRGAGWLNTTAHWVDLSPTPTGADDPHSDAAPALDLIPVTHERRRSYDFDGERLKLASDSDRVGRCHHCAITSCTPK